MIGGLLKIEYEDYAAHIKSQGVQLRLQEAIDEIMKLWYFGLPQWFDLTR